MTLTTDPLRDAIAAQQCRHPEFGSVYECLYRLSRRIKSDFYNLQDRVDMPKAILRFGQLAGARKAEYCSHDTTFRCVITIDPTKFLTLSGVAEYLAHEICHMWMDWLGYKPEENGGHGEPFADAMANYGIKVEGGHGDHVGYIGELWPAWLAKVNEELRLSSFLLSSEPKTRYLYKCPVCGRTVEHGRSDLVLTCHHEMDTDTPGAFMSHVLH